MRLRQRGFWVLALALTSAACSEPRAVNLLMITLDTVRRDHLEPYGYARPTTPALSRLADRSIVFENAIAQDVNTNPSHVSMFTGVYPHVHGSISNGRLLDEGQVTLSEILGRQGFRTGGFISGLPLHRDASGFHKGFEHYDDEFDGWRRRSALTTNLASAWRRELGREERYFLFVHLYDAHGPYMPGEYLDQFESAEPGPTLELEEISSYQVIKDHEGKPRTNLNAYVDRYDASIRSLDEMVRQLVDETDLDDTVVVILSDHGESLNERYYKMDHGGQVFDEQIRIPLILSVPGLASRRVNDLVETIDLLPTLLHLFEIQRPEDRPVQGRSLVPLLHGESLEPRTFALASSRASSGRHRDRAYKLDGQRRIYALRSLGWKLIQYPSRPEDHLELYDMESDPLERKNVAESFPDRTGSYRRALGDELGGVGPVGSVPSLPEGVREKLKALGYLGD